MIASTSEPKEKYRLNFDFPPERIKELRELLEETGGGSMKDLVSNALTLLQWSIDETKNGHEIAAVNDDDQTFRVLVTPLLQRVKKLHSRPKTESKELHAL